MNSRFVKWAALALAMVLCCTTMIGCKDKDGSSLPDSSLEESLYPTKPSTSEGATTSTLPALNESKLDASLFTAMGVSADEAQSVFTKLGFAELSEPVDGGDGNYTIYPYGVKETPLLVKVADGKIAQVVLSNLHVADDAKNDYYNDGILPETWYLKGDNGYKDDPQHTISVLLYDTVNAENPFVAGVDWNDKKTIYF